MKKLCLITLLLFYGTILSQPLTNWLEFDGTDEFVNIHDNPALDLTNNYTIEVWVFPSSFSSLGGIVSKYHTPSSNGYTLRLNETVPYTGINFDGVYTDNGILTNDKWYHIAAVNDNGTRRIYVDGIEQTTNGTPHNTAINTDALAFGVDFGMTSARFFYGHIDDVRLWNDVRTQQEIQNNMHLEVLEDETNLTGYWKLNETSGTNAPDGKGGNNGTLSNMENDDWINIFSETSISLDDVSYSSQAWSDYDNDGDLDILLSGIFGSGKSSKIYKNNGNGSFTEQTGISLTGITDGSVAWGDYNNDGNMDILLSGDSGSGYISKIYKNDGNNSFTEQTGISLTGVAFSSVAWGDYNNDGNLDILLSGDSGSDIISMIFKNNGDGSFTEQTGISLTGALKGSVAWGDYDNDEDLDILISGWFDYNNYSKIYKNNGNNSFTEQPEISLPGIYQSSVAWGDCDNDGDLDILLSGYALSELILKIYRNNGYGSFTEQPEISLPGVYQSSVAWGDYNNDGNLDILLIGNSGSTQVTKIYRNDGVGTFTEVTGISLPGVDFGSVAWGDYDNDLDLDILLNGWSDTGYVSKIYMNNCITKNIVPNSPENLSSSVVDCGVTFSWDIATDNSTPSAGLTYNLCIGTTPGGNQIMSPMASISNGYQKVLTLGNTNHNTSWKMNLPSGQYYWSVQAIDHSFTGSEFVNGGSFLVDQFSITTSDITEITRTTAICSGNVTDEGVSSVTAKGIVWNTVGNPTVDLYDGKTNDGNGLGSFTSSITGLTSGQTYSVRAYATNSKITKYGEEKIFTTTMISPGNTYNFNGIDDYVQIEKTLAASISGNSAITIEYWFKGSQLQSPVRIQNGSDYIVAGWGASNPQYLISSDLETCRVSIGPESVVEDGNWHHLAMTLEQGIISGFKSYLDGELFAQSNVPNVTLPIFNETYTYLGSYNGISEFMTGCLDEVRIWNDVRTKTEIQNNMFNTLNGDEDDLIAYYHFDHISGSLLNDITANNNGTLHNTTDNYWVVSTAPIGDDGLFIQDQAQNKIGDNGKQIQVTITLGGDESNYLGIYCTGEGTSTIDWETFPSGVRKRTDLFWGIEEFGDCTANLVFDYSNVTGLNFNNQLKLCKRTDATGVWIDVSEKFTNDTQNKTFTCNSGIKEFSEFTIGETTSPLPVELVFFTVASTSSVNGEPKIALNWETATEVNNYGFEIQSSVSSSEYQEKNDEFETIGFVPGHGNSNSPKHYEFIDTNPSADSTEYRLKQIDTDGTFTYYSQTVKLGGTLTGVDEKALPTEYSLEQNYPNPFNPSTVIEYSIPRHAGQANVGTLHATTVQLKVYDLLGREVEILVNKQQRPGRYKVEFNANHLASGVYIYQLKTNTGFIDSKKLTLMK